MGLQTSQAHVLGRDQKFYVIKETTPGTFVKATTAASANCITTSFQPNTKRKDRTDAFMASRDIIERITDKEEISWTYDGFYIPSGTKNAAPDIGDMILAAMGVETVNANDVTYTLNSSQAMTALSMTRHFSEIYQESLAGCIVDTMKFTFAGGEEPKVSFGGRAMSYAHTGTSTLNGAMVGATTTMVVQTADKNSFMTNPNAAGTAGLGARSVVQIDDGSSPQTDAEITADAGTGSFTIDTGGTHDDAAAVTPWVPDHSDSGSPIAGIAGTFTWDSFAAKITALEFELSNNLTYNDDEAFAAGMTDAIPNLREITGSMTFRVRQDHVVHILNRRELAVKALALTVGGAAQSGTQLQISMPYCELEFNEVSVPETEEATINATFKALGSSGNDALTIIHT
jgi:hypothetical protein